MIEPTIAICICTRDRPHELARALNSLPRSAIAVDQVVVADDGTDSATEKLVRTHAGVEFVRGPQSGLGANRNRAIESVCTTHVLFLDDDAELDPEFLAHARRCLDLSVDQPRTIITGREMQGGTSIQAHDLTFLGFQRRPYAAGDALMTIVINGTLFPRSLFDQIRFDPQLVYGYEETDIAARAVHVGFHIVFCPAAINRHHRSDVGRSAYSEYIDASRLYSTWKRYARVEQRAGKGLLYLALGSTHQVAAGLRRDGLSGAARALRAIALGLTYIWRLLRDPGLDRC